MKTSYSILMLLISISTLQGQIKPTDLKNSIQFSLGFSKHGTGDMNGYVASFEHIHDFKNRSFVVGAFSSTLHNGAYSIFYNDQLGNTIDGSYRYTTGGFQIEGRFGLYLIKSTRSRLGSSLGPILRYQSSSFYDELNILFPLATGLPFPVIAIINKTPQNTVTVGGKINLFYNYMVSPKNYLGINASFQTDSINDVISSFMLAVGWKL